MWCMTFEIAVNRDLLPGFRDLLCVTNHCRVAIVQQTGAKCSIRETFAVQPRPGQNRHDAEYVVSNFVAYV